MMAGHALKRDPAGSTIAPRVPEGERVYAIGDIHGRLDLFETLVARIREDNEARPSARVRIVLLGDLVDRGPDSAALVTRCRAFTGRSNRFVVLKGNHEALMVHAIRGNFVALGLWLRNGGDAALRSWGVPAEIVDEGASPDLMRAARAHVPDDLVAWMDALPLTLRIGSYLFVHAGIRPGVTLADQSPDDLMWIRREFLDSEADHSFVVVHGHSVNEAGVDMQPNRIGIDTGAYRTDVLTALALGPDRRWTPAPGPGGS